MTPQEEALLVQIIVQCVRRVLEMQDDPAIAAPAAQEDGTVSAYTPSQGARFIDIVQPRGAQNGRAVHPPGEDRSDVRASLQRFMRQSEQMTIQKTTQKSAGQNGTTSEAALRAAPATPRKRQVITQADILDALKQEQTVIVLQPEAIVTPLARQVAKEKGIELR